MVYDNLNLTFINFWLGNRHIRHNFLALGLGTGTHLVIKAPRPEDSEGMFSVFESSCHMLLPV